MNSNVDLVDPLNSNLKRFIEVSRINLGYTPINLFDANPQAPKVFAKKITPNSFLVKMDYDEEEKNFDYICGKIKLNLLETGIAKNLENATKILNDYLDSNNPNPDDMKVFKYIKDETGNNVLGFFDVYLHPICLASWTLSLFTKIVTFGQSPDFTLWKGLLCYKQGAYENIRKDMKFTHTFNKIIKRRACCQFHITKINGEFDISDFEEASFESPFERIYAQMNKMKRVMTKSSSTNSYKNYRLIFEAFNKIIDEIRNHQIMNQGLEAIRCFKNGDNIINIVNDFISDRTSFNTEESFEYALLIALTYMKMAIGGSGIKNNTTTRFKNVNICPNAMNNKGTKFIFSIKRAKETVSSFINYIFNNIPSQLKGDKELNFSMEISTTQIDIFKQHQDFYTEIKPYINVINDMQSILNEENILGLRMIMSEEQYNIEPIRFNLIN